MRLVQNMILPCVSLPAFTHDAETYSV